MNVPVCIKCKNPMALIMEGVIAKDWDYYRCAACGSEKHVPKEKEKSEVSVCKCGWKSWTFIKWLNDGWALIKCRRCGLEIPHRSSLPAIQVNEGQMGNLLCTSCADDAVCKKQDHPADYSCFKQQKQIPAQCGSCISWPGCPLSYPSCNKFNLKCLYCGSFCTKRSIPEGYPCFTSKFVSFNNHPMSDPETFVQQRNADTKPIVEGNKPNRTIVRQTSLF